MRKSVFSQSFFAFVPSLSWQILVLIGKCHQAKHRCLLCGYITGGDSKSVCPPLKFKLTAEGRVQMIPDSAAAVDYCLAIPVRLALL